MNIFFQFFSWKDEGFFLMKNERKIQFKNKIFLEFLSILSLEKRFCLFFLCPRQLMFCFVPTAEKRHGLQCAWQIHRSVADHLPAGDCLGTAWSIRRFEEHCQRGGVEGRLGAVHSAAPGYGPAPGTVTGFQGIIKVRAVTQWRQPRG